jgi:DNA-binding transcriptional MocR family regulator
MSNAALTQAWAVTGITQCQKLVLVRLADRANERMQTWPSLERIATECCCSRSTVAKNIKELVDIGLVVSERRTGPHGSTSNMYTLKLPTVIVKDGECKEYRETDHPLNGPSEKRTPDSPTNGPTPVLETDPNHKINHHVNHQKSPTPVFDPVAYLDESAKEGAYNNLAESEAFKAAWADFVQHRKEMKKPMTMTATRLQLKRLAAWGVSRAVEAIELSVSKGWQSIWEEKDGKLKKRQYTKEELDLMPGCHDFL